MNFYTGIGARKTPKEVLETFKFLGSELAKNGWVLRSGGCDGADLAFERGHDLGNVGQEKEIYLPWKGYNGSNSELYDLDNLDQARLIAESLHPNWNAVNDVGVKYLSRDVLQVLGKDLCTFSKFVVCWTPDGRLVGGTSMAMRVADDNHIKVFNAGSYDLDLWAIKRPGAGQVRFVDEVMRYAESVFKS